MAAAVADRVKQAKFASLAHVLPLNNPVRVAEELAMLDYLTGGRLVVSFLRCSVLAAQTSPSTSSARRRPWHRNSGALTWCCDCSSLPLSTSDHAITPITRF
jgi:hypothetical protein